MLRIQVIEDFSLEVVSLLPEGSDTPEPETVPKLRKGRDI